MDGDGAILGLAETLRMNERRRAYAGFLAIFLSASLAAQAVVFHGRVLDATGRPLAGAEVRSGEATAASAGDGVFHLGGVVSGARIVVSAEGFASREFKFIGAGTPSVIELVATGFVAGRVVDEKGEPIAAEVVIEYFGFARTLVKLGDDGRFRATLRAEGKYRLRAKAVARREVETEWQERPRDDLELVLVPAASKTVHVRARDARTGEAVRDFRALLAWGPDFEHGNAYRMVAWGFRAGGDVASVDGAAALQVFAPMPSPPNRPLVALLAEGYALTMVEDLSSLDIPLEREAVIEGFVRDARTGQPLAGVEVWSVPQELTLTGDTRTETDPWGAVRSGVDGRFRLANLGAGEHAVHARLAGRPAHRELVAVIAGEAVACTLAMSAGGRLTLTLTGGELPIGTELRVLREGGPYRDHTALVVDGAATLTGVPVGRCRVTVRWPAPMQQGNAVDVLLGSVDVREDADDRTAFDVRDKQPGVVRGRLSARGALSPDRLLVTSIGDQVPHHDYVSLYQAMIEGWRAPVSATGDYELSLPPGRHRLRVYDLETGFVVHLDQEIDVESGIVPRDLEVAPARLRVRAAQTDERLWIALPGRIVSDSPWEFDGMGTPSALPMSGDREVFVLPGQVKVWCGDFGASATGVTLQLQPGERREVDLPAKGTEKR